MEGLREKFYFSQRPLSLSPLKVKFTSIPMTSAPRVERVDDLVVDSQGLDPPTDKWLQAAREAADTDGIRENAYAERLQMCISCCTLMCMFPMVPNMYRVSHSRYVSERVSPSYSTTGIGPFYKNMESLPVAPVPPKSLPRHSRGTPEQLPSSCRARCRSPHERTHFRTRFENHQNPGSNP